MMDGGVLTYEELTGGQGRRVVYRSTRYDPESVFGGNIPRVTFNGSAASLQDLSASGLALFWNAGSAVPLSAGEKTNVSLDYDGDVILDIPCVTRRIDTIDAGVVIGLSVDGDLLDIARVRDRARHMNVAAQAQRALCAVQDAVSLEYRGFCADVLMFLRKYRTLSTADLAPGCAVKDQDAVFEVCREPFLREWGNLRARGNKLVRAASADQRQATAERNYGFELMRPEFEIAGVWNALVSSSVQNLTVHDIALGRAAHHGRQASAQERLLDCAAEEALEVFTRRMASVTAYIAEQAKRAKPGSTLRVVSLAGGESPELPALKEAVRGMDVSVELHVVDWREALLQASYTAHMAAPAGNVKVRHTLLSRDALRESAPAKLAANNDIVYSSALCDGLDDAAFIDHVIALERYVHPSGAVLMAGLIDDDYCPRWALEHLAGLKPFYRDADEIRHLLQQKTDRTVCYAQGLGDGVICLKGNAV